MSAMTRDKYAPQAINARLDAFDQELRSIAAWLVPALVDGGHRASDLDAAAMFYETAACRAGVECERLETFGGLR